MWCQHCQQDVPAIIGSGERKFCCPRCGQPVGAYCPTETDERAFSSESPSQSARIEELTSEEKTSYDCWDLDDQLWSITQALQVYTTQDHRREKNPRHEVSRFDPAHDALSPRHAPPAPVMRESKLKSQHGTGGGSFLAVLIWAGLLLGTAALACGGLLLGWSFITGRNELWNIGLPIATGGQLALLVGLILQLERFWHNNHHTASKLNEVDEQLHELKSSAALLSAIHGPSSTPLRTHLAGGENPQLLLGDLKTRLDLLAMKIDEQESE